MKKSHVVIFNRSALSSADGWIHVVPKGDLPNREAGIVQVLDDESLEAIMTGITQDQKRLGDKWPGIYAGREHFIYDPAQDSAALAWFKDFQKRDDGIWANADGLTQLGSDAVKNRLYKFTSFVADRGDLAKTDGASTEGLPRYRVMKIDTIGFTNQANGKELLTPITNRAGEEVTGLHTAATKKLGLTAGADENIILAEITKLQNRADTLTAENQSLISEQLDAIFAEHKLTDSKVINRLKPMLAPLPNRAERVAFLAELGLKPETKETRITRVLNRGANQAIATTITATDEPALARRIQNRAVELQTTGLKFDTAWQQAQREIFTQP
ncbi:MAG TPA: phage protease [Verrucomicrobiae bacterium]|nr:phage protease [Verrucomicrobiae bacterium]